MVILHVVLLLSLRHILPLSLLVCLVVNLFLCPLLSLSHNLLVNPVGVLLVSHQVSLLCSQVDNLCLILPDSLRRRQLKCSSLLVLPQSLLVWHLHCRCQISGRMLCRVTCSS
jgi:hypothetical protein